ncbi:hypothetical protein [Cellulomonas sp. NPDC058312]|uniref:hypothetical protein n=1 Tax=Cellulomonas sp. NPDC058312 TaxID=3346441 RepID=UPI0036E8537A
MNDDQIADRLQALEPAAMGFALVGAALAVVALTLLYTWWLITSITSDRRRRTPTQMTQSERRRAGEAITEIVDAVENDVDRARLGAALMREPRRRRRVQVTTSTLASVAAGGATLTVLTLWTQPSEGAETYWVLMAALVVLFTVQISTLLLTLRVYRRIDRRAPLTAAAVVLARVIFRRPEETSEFDARTQRVEGGRRLRDAFVKAAIPEADLDLLHQIAAEDATAWKQMKTTAMLQLTRAFAGEFIRAPDIAPGEPSLSWWQRQSAVVLTVIALITALVTFVSRLLPE